MGSRGRIFIVDDDGLLRSMLLRALKGEGYDVRAEAEFGNITENVRAFDPGLVLLDIRLPGASGIDILRELRSDGRGPQVIMLTADDTAETAIRAMKLGAADYLVKPFNLDKVKLVVAGVFEKERLRQEVEYLRKVRSEYEDEEIVGESAVMKDLLERTEKIAAAGVQTVLISGESGTGKERFARHLHALMHPGGREGYSPFVGVNCAALPEQLIESELFGHEKGAFTDAKEEKKGVFEFAAGGSILLDEIGEMALPLQSKFLRVLEERTVRRLGGRTEIPVEATILATTNRNLAEAVDRGTFRMDLYYRLTAFSIVVPPLRERREDIPRFARHFLSRFADRYNRKRIGEISPEAVELLCGYPWPGNVRELRNVMERIVVLESVDTLLPGHLPAEVRNRSLRVGGTDKGYRAILPEGGVSLDDLERDLIVQALERAGNNKTHAAKLLNITYDSLRYQVRKFGLE